MNKGRLVLGIGLIVLAITIFTVSNLASIELFGLSNRHTSQSIVSKQQDVENIHSIKADGIVHVYISNSDTEKVRFVFDENQFKNTSSFDKGVLNIDFASKKSGFTFFPASNSKVDVYVSVKTLKHIEMNGVGTVKTKNKLRAHKLKLINKGTGSMKLEVAATKIMGRNAGVGSLKIIGKADSASLYNQGVGSFNANKLVVKVLQANNQGVGSMKVYAEEIISLKNSGVGSLHYSGDARVVSQRSDGIGNITKR